MSNEQKQQIIIVGAGEDAQGLLIKMLETGQNAVLVSPEEARYKITNPEPFIIEPLPVINIDIPKSGQERRRERRAKSRKNQTK